MSVYGISHNNYSMQIWQQLQQDADGTRSGSRTASSSSASGSMNAAANQAYGGSSMVDHLSSAIQSAMDTLGLKPGDKVTFATIAQARKKMEDQFSEDVKSGLQELGIGDDVDYSLVSDGKGGVTVLCDHEDKAKIEQYFKDNPEMAERFNEIQSMTNVDQARKVQGLGMDATNKREQIASLLNWFTGSGQTVNQLMRFDSGNTLFSAIGLSLTA